MGLVKTDAQFSRILLVLICIGLLARVLAVLALGDYQQPLTAEYGLVARNLADGKGFVGGGWLGPEAPTALNVPIYPMFVALWLRVGGNLPFLGVELTQAVLSASMVYFVAQIALRLSDRLTGLVAGGLVAFYPPLIYFCKQISPAVLTAFAASISLYALLLLMAKQTWTRAVVSGVVFGLALLVEPILLLALPGAILIEMIFHPKRAKRPLWGKLLATAAVCGLVLLPWVVRNYVVFDQWVPLKTSFGLNLWLGNNPNATGILYTLAGEPMQSTLPPEVGSHLATLNEAQRYSTLAETARSWIQDNPQRFLQLTAKRIGYMWWISPTYQITTQNITEPQFFYTARAWIQAVVLALGLVGGGAALMRNRHLLVQCVWWLVAFTLPYAITVAGNTRYRLPAESMLLILVAFGLAEATRWVLASRGHLHSMEMTA
jgi:4-amino-4-deoxy-L-arabinose transferase-like glycosyltransferase